MACNCSDCIEWLEGQIGLIKEELNDMALMGVKPMWNSLIARLEQLADDLREQTKTEGTDEKRN